MPGNFDKLFQAARIGCGQFPCLHLVFELSDKRQHIAMYEEDLPNLVHAFRSNKGTPVAGNPQVRMFDPRPSLRLSSACEGLAGTVYSACEVAAAFANGACDRIPKSFNLLRKKILDGGLDASLVGDQRSLDWYAKVRELRTEWTHHSTIFIGHSDKDPAVVVKPLRRRSDRVVLPERAVIKVDDLLEWTTNAIGVLDDFVLRVYERYILPKVDLDRQFDDLVPDKQGFPQFTATGSVETQRVTVRDYLRGCGFSVS